MKGLFGYLISNFFEETETNEKEFVKLWYKILSETGTIIDCIKVIADGEAYEWNKILFAEIQKRKL